MAKSIKGINIKIGAETTGLKRALSDVEKQSRSIGKELYKVNRGLRFNPKSTELLSQKQDLLKDRVEATRKKLETLKEAQDDIKKQYKKGEIDDGQYRAFQRELVTTENKLENFNRQLKETNKQARNVKLGLDDLKKAGQTLAVGMAAVGTAVAVAGKELYDLSKETANYADEMDKAAQKTGLSVEAAQEWNYILDQNGTSLAGVSSSLQRFTRNVANAAEGGNQYADMLNNLNVEIQDSNGNLRDMDEVFPETIKALSEMENETERNATAMELFGRSGKELIPILNSGTESIEDLQEKANDLDLVMSEQDIQSWVDFKDEMTTLNEQFKSAKRQLATEFLPFLQYQLAPFLQNDLIPKVTLLIDKISELAGLPFTWEGGDELRQELMNIEDLAEAEARLAKKRQELEEMGPAAQYAMGSDKQRKEHVEQQEQLEDEVSLLEYLIQNWNILKNTKSEAINSGEDDDGEETVVDSGLSDYEKFIESLDQDISDYKFDQKLSKIVEDYQKEVKKLQRDKSNRLSLIDTFDISDEEAEQAKEKVRQLYNNQIADVIATATEKHRKQQAEAREEERQEEIKLQQEILENRYEMNDLSITEYRKYLRKRLAEYDKYTDEWVRLRKKLNEILKSSSDPNEFSSNLADLGRMGRESSSNYEGKDDTEEQVKAINWIAQGFNDLGYEIEEANQAFKDFKQDLSDGISEAIVQGESLSDVFGNVADQFSKMVIQKSIVDPLLNWGMGKIGIPTFHDGGLVSPANAIKNIQRYHSGGGVGLKNDEVPAILENGEYVLNKDQVKSAGKAGTNITEIHNHINAIDTKSFAEYVSRNPDAIVGVIARDYSRNGTTRKIIKKG